MKPIARTTAALAAGVVTVAAVALSAGAAQAKPDTAHVLGADAPGAIAGEYIVVMEDAATEIDADVVETYDSIDGHLVEATASEARELAAADGVAYVEQNAVVSLSATQSDPTWGLDRVDQRDLPLDDSYTYGADGAGVTAYIIDTGIRADHTEFTGRIAPGFDFVNNDSDPSDCNGHGTHVAGTVGGTTYGVAKSVRLAGVRVLDCRGSGTYAGVIAGIDWVADNAQRPAVANMSLGGGFSSAVNDAVTAAVDSGVPFAVAAGNEGADACQSSPASTPAAITVGATDSSDARPSWSNYGSCVDVFAPGVDITSAWHRGKSTNTNTISGTSMASPHVAGAAALYLSENPNASASAVASWITGNATSGVVSGPGSGSPNLLLYTL